MTHLRKMMLEELQRRNYSAETTRNYLRWWLTSRSISASRQPGRSAREVR